MNTWARIGTPADGADRLASRNQSHPHGFPPSFFLSFVLLLLLGLLQRLIVSLTVFFFAYFFKCSFNFCFPFSFFSLLKRVDTGITGLFGYLCKLCGDSNVNILRSSESYVRMEVIKSQKSLLLRCLFVHVFVVAVSVSLYPSFCE